MKKIILVLTVLFITQIAFSQKIILHRNAGGDQTYYISSVDSITFLPFACGDEIRYEGQTYHTVLIGSQCLMKENLNVGTRINGAMEHSNNGVIEKYCYNDDTANCTIYGGLYQWDEAMQYITTAGAQGLCPAGSHIPTTAEWSTLLTSVSVANLRTGGTSGFDALLAGFGVIAFPSIDFIPNTSTSVLLRVNTKSVNEPSII